MLEVSTASASPEHSRLWGERASESVVVGTSDWCGSVVVFGLPEFVALFCLTRRIEMESRPPVTDPSNVSFQKSAFNRRAIAISRL